MKKLLIALLLVPTLGMADNYFVDGTVWNYGSMAGRFAITHCGNTTYSLEGTETTAGVEAAKLYKISDFDPATKTFVTYVRAEGDKVMILPIDGDGTWVTLYDFSLRPDTKFTGTSLSGIPREFTCKSLLNDAAYGDMEALTVTAGVGDDTSESTWLLGVGGTVSFDLTDGGIGNIDLGQLWNVTAKGETVCRRSESQSATVFEPYTLWMSETFGSEPAKVKEWIAYQVTEHKADTYVIGRSVDNAEGTEVSRILVEGEQVYRYAPLMNPDDDEMRGLAYDFSMQPGDVRQITALSGEMTSSWMVCENRRPSELFPDRDEIILVEYADQELTRRVGRGAWIAGIGTVHGVLANSRFDSAVAETQLYRVVAGGEPVWERSLDGIAAIAPDAAGIQVTTSGRLVMADCSISLYSIDGRLVGTGFTVTAPAAGIYVAASQAGAVKVAVK